MFVPTFAEIVKLKTVQRMPQSMSNSRRETPYYPGLHHYFHVSLPNGSPCKCLHQLAKKTILQLLFPCLHKEQLHKLGMSECCINSQMPTALSSRNDTGTSFNLASSRMYVLDGSFVLIRKLLHSPSTALTLSASHLSLHADVFSKPNCTLRSKCFLGQTPKNSMLLHNQVVRL